MLPKEVIKLYDDESESLVVPDVVASATPSEAGPSAPHATAPPDTSGDEAFARDLFITLNREAIGIPGDGSHVDLVSNEEDYRASSDGEEEEGTASGEEEKKAAVIILVGRRPPCPLRQTHRPCRSGSRPAMPK